MKLTGTLARKTYPGPPNYESVRQGDLAETYLLLELPQPICVDASQREPDLDPAQTDIRRIQLVVEPAEYKAYRILVGKRVLATGTLFGAHSGHHHTAVLLTVGSLNAVE